MGLNRSWVDSANSETTDFPLNNLPYGVFSFAGAERRMGVAIGGNILDLRQLSEAHVLRSVVAPDADGDFFRRDSWNGFMALGPDAWAALRSFLTESLSADAPDDRRRAMAEALLPMAGARLHMPFDVVEYTDFYAGKQHAINVGTMFRGAENALPPNWLHIPIGYNGRASTVVVSGTEIRRPLGQIMAKGDAGPRFGPSRRLDIELEMGAVVGTPSRMGAPVTAAQAQRMIFGYVLLNDWSARDLQAWEYQPLGPFQAKAFATSISPWIVTRAALAPFARPTPPRERPLLPYLHEDFPSLYDIALSVEMAPAGARPTVISRTNAACLYYSAAQQLVHHASSGCAMRTGDLLGSGTISGPEPDGYGSLLELTWGGERPLTLDGGARRSFIEDGDTLTLRGHAEGRGYRVGFGACTGRILPAPDFP